MCMGTVTDFFEWRVLHGRLPDVPFEPWQMRLCTDEGVLMDDAILAMMCEVLGVEASV